MDNQDPNAVSQWLEKNRKDSYVLDVGRDNKGLASIFMVPITLRENDAIFTPQAISLGPYHFLKPNLAEMESEKSQVIARTVMSKLPEDSFAPLQMVRNRASPSGLKDDNFFRCVAPRCRDFYGDAHLLQNLNDEAFATMLFRDASFLLLFLSNRRQRKNSDKYSNPFRHLKSGEGLWFAVMTDVFKLENQIPLYALEWLYAFFGSPLMQSNFKDFVARVCSRYSPLWIEDSHEEPHLGSCRHLLHYIHARLYRKRHEHGDSDQRSTHEYRWFPLARLRKRNDKEDHQHKQSDQEVKLRNERKIGIPSASDLSKIGVKFGRCEGGIEQIRFDTAHSTLYLPVLKIGIMTETIVRNLIAFEVCSPEIEENAVTAFIRLLKELTRDNKDVELLRKNEIYATLGLDDEEIVEIVKRLNSSTWNPVCKPVNDARKSLYNYYIRNSWKNFRNQLWVLITASFAGSVVLIMTAVQVFCAFYTCNIK